MNLVRNHAEARWMPSRHCYALFRLFAYLRLRNARPERSDIMLAIERHQSNMETMLVAAWMVLTVAGCLAGTTFPSWHLALAIPAAILAAMLSIQILMIVSALVIAPLFPGPGARVNSIVLMTLTAALAAYSAMQASWMRFAGLQFLALVALNAIAAAIMFLLRNSVAELEASIAGGASSVH